MTDDQFACFPDINLYTYFFLFWNIFIRSIRIIEIIRMNDIFPKITSGK